MISAKEDGAKLRTDLDPRQVRRIVQTGLEEDWGGRDISSLAFSAGATARGILLGKQDGILAGLPVAEAVFREIESDFSWRPCVSDGSRISKGQTVAEFHGNLRSILAGERLALNLIQRMSGIATLTRRFVDLLAGTSARLLDTRKTAPGLRVLDKYAVRMGGGHNHRFALYDGVILKDNHVRAAGGVEQAVQRLRQTLAPGFKIEVEVGTLAEVEAALRAGVEIVMLDNMPISQMAEAVRMVAGRALVEASGGITLQTVREVAATGVDFISVGAPTHSAQALDISLEIVA